jgi:hypothetical protein
LLGNRLVADALLESLRMRRNGAARVQFARPAEQANPYDRLADAVEGSLDLARVFEIIGLPSAARPGAPTATVAG